MRAPPTLSTAWSSSGSSSGLRKASTDSASIRVSGTPPPGGRPAGPAGRGGGPRRAGPGEAPPGGPGGAPAAAGGAGGGGRRAAPPLEVGPQLHDLVDGLEGLHVAVPGHDPGVLVLDL